MNGFLMILSSLVGTLDKLIDFRQLVVVMLGWCARGYRPPGFRVFEEPEN
jgi:hypothetical protein